MPEQLCSVGLDVGTSTTQLIVSKLLVENRASSFAVPKMEITGREILYRGNVHFTPLLDDSHVDGAAIKEIVAAEYRKAGIRRQDVDTGAIIITGETSRKENARAVLDALSEFAGNFVVATAGPDLESVLAAKGAGVPEYTESIGQAVLHMDIGGGTSNLALAEDGKILRTGCLNIGGRLIKLEASGTVTYVSPVLQDLCDLQPGQRPAPAQLESIATLLVQALEMAAGLRQPTSLLNALTTHELGRFWDPPCKPVILSFSGGVADCIETQHPPLAFGDIGPILGQAIRRSRLCAGRYRLGAETIRATVIGAGCHSAQLSGSTVFYRGVSLPLQNLPVVRFTEAEQNAPDFSRQIAQRIAGRDSDAVVLSMPGFQAPSYQQLTALAEKIQQGTAGMPVFLCLETDMAKALGHCLCLHLPPDTPCLCLDRVYLSEDSFLDVGAPLGPCLPVVVKTLVLSQNQPISAYANTTGAK